MVMDSEMLAVSKENSIARVTFHRRLMADDITTSSCVRSLLLNHRR